MCESPSGGFELQDHTADIALYVFADSIEQLFRHAADGFYAVVGDVVATSDVQQITLRFEACDVESLLHDFLSELLFLFETRQQRLTGFIFERLDDKLLIAEATAATVDPRASMLDREVKAITYHDLSVTRRHDRFETTVILDI